MKDLQEALLHLSLNKKMDAGNFLEAGKLISLFVHQVLDVSRCTLWELSKDQKSLSCLCLSEDHNIKEPELLIQHSDFPLYFNTLQTERTIIANEAEHHKATAELTESYLQPLEIKSKLDAPFRFEGKTIGILCLEHQKETRVWKQEEIVFMAAITEVLSRAYTAEMHKYSQDLLSRTNRDLEAMVLERTKKLMQAEKNMMQQEAMSSLGQLVSGVAHEINTPLGVSITAATLLSDTLQSMERALQSSSLTKSNLEQGIADGIETSNLMFKNLNRAAELVQSFKKLSAHQSQEEEVYDFDLKEIIKDTLQSLSHKIKQKNVDILLTLPEKIQLHSSPGKFSQIFTNLIVNSLTHAFQNQKKPRIEIEASLKEHTLFVHYKDNGKGIPKENLEKAFTPFFTTARNQGGTGLGLNIIDTLIREDLGGQWEFSSEETKGFSFGFHISFDSLFRGKE